ncbi:MAG TPA: HupE/UreJ family protein, partial [Crenotrichaceae bacterium]|nr:HupE/UreJ family protein [Crenotrichaceae bacterium]
SLAIPLLSRFARGHRQHLSVRDKNGNQMVQKILSKQSGVVKIQVAEISMLAVFKQYFTEGVWHIWIGFDHILFLLTLLLPAVMVYRQHRWQSVAKLLPAITDTLKIITAFTVAHSITLALAVLKIVQLPSRDVEIVIALSVLITAVNNLIPVFCRYRWLLAFGFGLIHGFGFASVLNNLGLEPHSIVSSLIGFNLGVEFGQLVIVCLFLPFAFMASHTLIYRQWVLNGGSVLAGIVACIWIVERVTDVELFGGVGLFLN